MSPRLVHLFGPFWITSYGLFVVLGVIVFIYLAYSHPERRRYLSDEHFMDAAASGTLGGIIGGKVLYIIQEMPDLSSVGMFMEAALTGFAILGAIIGTIIGIVMYAHDNKLRLWPVLDFASLYAPLALAIGRWGCVIGGCCFGQVMSTYEWWSMIYSDPTCLAPLQVPLYPTQLMLSGGSFLVFIFLRYSRVWSLHRRYPGIVFCAYLFGESLVRFVVDFWRGDRELTGIRMLPGIHYTSWWQVWSFHQKVAFWLMCGALALAFYRYYMGRREKRKGR